MTQWYPIEPLGVSADGVRREFVVGFRGKFLILLGDTARGYYLRISGETHYNNSIETDRFSESAEYELEDLREI